MQRYHLDVTVRRELGKTLGAIKAAAWVRIAGIHIHDCFSLKAEGQRFKGRVVFGCLASRVGARRLRGLGRWRGKRGPPRW